MCWRYCYCYCSSLEPFVVVVVVVVVDQHYSLFCRQIFALRPRPVPPVPPSPLSMADSKVLANFLAALLDGV